MSNSATSSANSANSIPSLDWKTETTRHWAKMARLKQWLGVIAAQSLEDEADRQKQARAAEENYVKEHVWNSPAPAEDDEMRQTILGDYHVTQTNPPAPPSLASKLLGPILLALSLGTPLAGFMVATQLGQQMTEPEKQPAIPTTPAERPDLDTDTILRLTLPDWE